MLRVGRGRRPRLVRRLLGGALPARVERGDDAEAAFGERLVTQIGRGPQEGVPAVRVVVDLLLHVIDDERWLREVDLADVLREPERLLLRARSPLGRDTPTRWTEPDHPVDDIVASQERVVRVYQWVVAGGIPDQSGEQRRLGQRDVRGG